jgi:hypothetical protein
MKKITALTILFLILVTSASAVDFYLKLGGGIGRIGFDSINQVLSDWEDEQILDAQSRASWNYISGEVMELRGAFELEGELKLDIHPNLGFSLSSGILHADLPADKTNLVIERTLGRYDVIHPIKVSGFPFILSGYFNLPMGPETRVYLRAGAGLMAARLVEQTGFKRVENPKYVIELDQNAVGSGRIYIAGLGISRKISQGAVIFLEGSYRSAQIQDFKNKEQENNSDLLYSYQKYNSDLDLWSSVMRFHANPPSGEDIRSVKKTAADMSGLSIKCGIMIHF